jgi:uncharacterized ion transporter superfamily protein YfcC
MNTRSILKIILIVLAIISIIGIPFVIIWFYFRKFEKDEKKLEIEEKIKRKTKIKEKTLLEDRLKELESSQNWSFIIGMILIFILMFFYVYGSLYFWFLVIFFILFGIPLTILRYMKDKEINEIKIKLVRKRK